MSDDQAQADRKAKRRAQAAVRMRAYRASHPESAAIAAARYRAANPEKYAASRCAYYVRNAEKVAARNAEYRAANLDRLAAYREANKAKKKLRDATPERKAYWSTWRAANKERIKARQVVNPELRAAIDARRKARKRGAGGSHSLAEWQAKCAEFGHRCAYCGDAKKLTRDHVVPISKGGTDYIDNIVPACHSCNSRKHVRSAEEFGLSRITTRTVAKVTIESTGEITYDPPGKLGP